MPIQDLIGTECPEFQVPVEWGKIREFAAAIGDENPIYRDLEYARRTPFGKVLAPPTFTVIKSFWRKGLSNQEMAGLDNRFVLHGEEEFEYLAPVLAGYVLTCKARISYAYEMAGKREGKMIFVVFEFAFFNQRGEKALVSRSTLIQTGYSGDTILISPIPILFGSFFFFGPGGCERRAQPKLSSSLSTKLGFPKGLPVRSCFFKSLTS